MFETLCRGFSLPPWSTRTIWANECKKQPFLNKVDHLVCKSGGKLMVPVPTSSIVHAVKILAHGNLVKMVSRLAHSLDLCVDNTSGHLKHFFLQCTRSGCFMVMLPIWPRITYLKREHYIACGNLLVWKFFLLLEGWRADFKQSSIGFQYAYPGSRIAFVFSSHVRCHRILQENKPRRGS